MERRDFLVKFGLGGMAATTGLAPDQVRRLFGAFAQESRTHASAVGLTNVGPGLLEQFQVELHQLAVAYVSESPSQVFPRMIDLRDRVHSLLRGHQRPQQTAQLHLLSGEASILIAGATVDFGDAHGAAAHALAALTDAETIGHDELRAWAYALLSRAHRYTGRLQSAVDAARQGQRFADRGHVLARLLELEARGLGEMGDRSAVRVVNRVAEVAHPAGLDLSDGLGGEFAVSEAWTAYSRGAVHLALGDLASAQQEHEHSLRLYAQRRDPSLSIVNLGRIHLAIVHARLGEVAGAREVLEPVLSMPDHHRLALYDSRLDDLSAVLAQPAIASPDTAHLAEQIATYRTNRPALSA